MFIKYFVFLCYFILIIYNNCLSQQGIVIFKNRSYTNDDLVLKPFNNMNDNKYYYKDSFVIVPEYYTYMYSKNNTAQFDSFVFKIALYKLFDLKTNTLYYFDSLSTKAKFIKKEKVSDSTRDGLLYNYFYTGSDIINYRDSNMVKSRVEMNDTIINKILFKRFNTNIVKKIDKKFITTNLIFYSRCDIKNNLFHIDKKYDENNKCIITRYDFKANDNLSWIVKDLDFKRFYLTKNEKDIFRKWIKFVHKNTIKY